MVKHGLGRGLSALIPETKPYFDAAGTGQTPGARPGSLSDDEMPQGGTVAGARAGLAGPGALVAEIELSRLRPNPGQPRKTFDEAALAELSSSIARHGMLQPILAEEDGEGGYVIVAGERRWRAALQAGLSRVPVIVRRLSLDSRLEVSLIENIQREDLNPLEEARAYQSLMELTSRTQDQIAEAVGKSRSAVANALRLLKLPEDMLVALRDGAISAGHARSLLAVADAAARAALFARIIREGLSVRQSEAAAQDASGLAAASKSASASGSAGKSRTANGPDALDPDLRAIRDRLIEAFGTKVDIRGDFDRGSVTVEYYSAEGLQRILDAVGDQG